MKIYILTSGSYSDYTIVAAFSSREKAEDEKARREYPHDHDIEEYELDPEPTNVPEDFVKGNVYGIIIMIEDGRIVDYDVCSNYCYRHPTQCIIDEKTLSLRLLKEKDKCIVVRSPISRDHAVKIAIERRQKYLIRMAPSS